MHPNADLLTRFYTALGNRDADVMVACYHPDVEFVDGRIIRYHDRFNFWRWATQALGPTGRLLGWTTLVKHRVRSQAAGGLDAFIERTGAGED